MLKLWDKFYVPGIHSVPLSDEHPDASPTYVPLRRALCALARRPVNIQATSDWVQYGRDVLFDQPFYTILDKDDRTSELPRWERELAEKRRAAQDAPPPDAPGAPDAP
jgi:hypothetical protein